MVQRLLELKSAADDAIARAFIDDKPETPQATTYPRPTPDTPANSKPGGASTIARVPNRQFVYALSDAFTVGFKARRNKPAEMIAKYLDSAMRKGQGSTSDESFERSLDEALALYRFTDDKDVFRTFYHRALAKRLLMERSASNDFETAMLKKLKESKSHSLLRPRAFTWLTTPFCSFSQNTTPSSVWARKCSRTWLCRGR